MTESLATIMEDSKFFSQRAKHISLLNEPTATVSIKPPPPSEVRLEFSNRTYVPVKDTQLTPVGRGDGSSLSNEHRQTASTGRGRTTVPFSSFVLQKDHLPSTINTISSPIFVMHDEVQFVRPYFGPPENNDLQTSSLTAHKRDVLLLALKEIESGLKAL